MVAAIGSPPVMRLIMIGRAVLPPPAMAPSTHLLPVALNALANSATAAASPPEVHQCVTYRSAALAAPRGRTTAHATAAAHARLLMSPHPDRKSSVEGKRDEVRVRYRWSTDHK